VRVAQRRAVDSTAFAIVMIAPTVLHRATRQTYPFAGSGVAIFGPGAFPGNLPSRSIVATCHAGKRASIAQQRMRPPSTRCAPWRPPRSVTQWRSGTRMRVGPDKRAPTDSRGVTKCAPLAAAHVQRTRPAFARSTRVAMPDLAAHQRAVSLVGARSRIMKITFITDCIRSNNYHLPGLERIVHMHNNCHTQMGIVRVMVASDRERPDKWMWTLRVLHD
jgi:hypothetical protein